ncbi:YbfB/YjiJ family MFS transporter [Paraburkholderia sp. MPAMCS5]|uniref:YbfB/YjiJ family MFS transporter n=1 Tax=Paraburkholderia sp. MPAMCS5 TaxID=3112563 RepID=UPI002E1909C9|nr:YbfB/YjiJ family MFS transporter [Paraburkholderia sp. MPAMCS5]
MNDFASQTPSLSAEPNAARRAALACMVTLAVALGVGRFAFTPLLPLMLHGGAFGQPPIDIQHGGWLASFNYAGYFVGALTCAALPVAPARMVRSGLVLTVLLTLAMGVTSQFWVWAVVRFVAGAVSAWTFVFASQWGLRRLAELRAPAWGGVIYTGPGVGIVGTGLMVSAAGGYGATAGWIGFGLISLVLTIVVWPAFSAASRAGAARVGARLDRSGRSEPSSREAAAESASESVARTAAGVRQAGVGEEAGRARHVGVGEEAGRARHVGVGEEAGRARHVGVAEETGRAQHVGVGEETGRAQHAAADHDTARPRAPTGFRTPDSVASNSQHAATAGVAPAAHRADAFWLILLYGVPGFGYIITATFLPVIARHALPGSPWPDLFWPMFGAALIVGALLAARLPLHWDNRQLLAGCYVLQACGIALGIVWPTAGGFSLGSILIGVPFTAITLFAMREARRLRGDDAAGLMGYATAAYGLGQIVGPLVAAPIAAHTGSFSPALWLAAGALLLGAGGLIAVARMPRGRGRMPDCGCG